MIYPMIVDVITITQTVHLGISYKFKFLKY